MNQTEEAKKKIIERLSNLTYDLADFTDLGNEIGFILGEYTKLKNAEEKALTKFDFITGLEHGISLKNKPN